MGELILMKKEDIEVCTAIYRENFEPQIYAKLYDEMYEKNRLERYFSHCINENDKYAYCFKEASEVIGFITAWQYPSTDYDYIIHIDVVAVTIKMQNKGFGTKMLKDFLDNVTKENTVYLNTKKNLPAYKMYCKLGFEDYETQRMIRSPRNIKIKKEIEEMKAEIVNKFPELKDKIDKLTELQKKASEKIEFDLTKD